MKYTPLLFALAIIGTISPAGLRAESDLATQVKAAYLFNFARFIQWPRASAAQETGTFTLCIVGDPQVSEALSGAQGEDINGRVLAVATLDDAHATTQCRMIFISNVSKKMEKALFDGAKDQPILTVTDARADPSGEGIISLVLLDGRLRFRVNQSAALRAGLHIPAQVLNLAVDVL